MITKDNITKVARLARIAVTDEQIQGYSKDLSGIFTLVGELNAVDLSGVEPMTSVAQMHQRMREDKINMPNDYKAVLTNAPEHIMLEESGYFIVPKVVG